jgi:hypothetical protein
VLASTGHAEGEPYEQGLDGQDAGAGAAQFNMFTDDERADIVRGMSRRSSGAYSPVEEEGSEMLWNAFLDRVKDRLHIVMCMQNDSLQRVGSMFPSILHNCYVNVVREWDDAAMVQIAQQRIDKVLLMLMPRMC